MKWLTILSGVFIGIFGLITLFVSSSLLFDLFSVRLEAGYFVGFVVGANFICSLLYILASYGFFKAKHWTWMLLGIASIILAIAFIGLMFYIKSGGDYQSKTIVALAMRLLISAMFSGIAFYLFKNRMAKEMHEV